MLGFVHDAHRTLTERTKNAVTRAGQKISLERFGQGIRRRARRGRGRLSRRAVGPAGLRLHGFFGRGPARGLHERTELRARFRGLRRIEPVHQVRDPGAHAALAVRQARRLRQELHEILRDELRRCIPVLDAMRGEARDDVVELERRADERSNGRRRSIPLSDEREMLAGIALQKSTPRQ